MRSLRSAEASQDLVMPGPDGPWSAALAAAVRDGRIAESVVDRKVLRILRLAVRVGALSRFETPAPAGNGTPEDGPGFAREAAAEGTVLLRNAGELPWRPERLSRIAVIGQHATQPRTQGGGSATVVPSSTVSPLQGIRAAFPGAEIVYEPGAVVQDGIIPFAPEAMTNPVTGEPGAHVRLLDEGIHIGYRAWLRTGTEPAYPSGYGLGYTTWDLGPAEVTGDNGDAAATIRVRLTNTGDRAGKHVVQAYAERAGSAVDRPVRWLVGFAAVHAEAAATTTVEIRVPHRTLAYWDAGWHVEPGTYTLRVGHNVRELPLALTITL